MSPESKRHFQLGVEFFKDPDGSRYEDAYREFLEAYRLSPSWKILGNLGLCALRMERNGEAIEAYERYLGEGGKEIEDGERAQITKDLALLKASAVTVTLKLTSAADVTVLDVRAKATGQVTNIYPLGSTKQTVLRVQAGHHTFTAKSQGREEKWEVDLTAGTAVDHTFSFTSPAAAASSAAPVASAPASAAASAAPSPPPRDDEPPKSSSLRTAGYVTAGVGGALVLGAVVTGLMAKSKESSVADACVNDHCPRDKASDADSAKSLAKTTNVLLVLGGVAAAAGATMIIVGKPKDGTALRVGPSVGQGFGGLVAHGGF